MKCDEIVSQKLWEKQKLFNNIFSGLEIKALLYSAQDVFLTRMCNRLFTYLYIKPQRSSHSLVLNYAILSIQFPTGY